MTGCTQQTVQEAFVLLSQALDLFHENLYVPDFVTQLEIITQMLRLCI